MTSFTTTLRQLKYAADPSLDHIFQARSHDHFRHATNREAVADNRSF